MQKHTLFFSGRNSKKRGIFHTQTFKYFINFFAIVLNLYHCYYYDMIGFLLKKTLYDLWDNMFKIVVLNIGFFLCTAIALLPAFLPRLFSSTMYVVALGVIGALVCSIYLAMVSFTVKTISDYGTFTFADFIGNFKNALPSGIAMFFVLLLFFFVAIIVIPFYAGMGTLLGLILTALIIWLVIFALLSFQFYYVVYVRLGQNIIKSFKKCMLISLDNTGLSIFLMIHNILALMLSVVLVFMFPGPAGVILYLDEAVRLRLLKYDWLEANPGADRRKIPWDELLIEERDKTGHRTFRNFIFPWKD